MRIKSQIQPLIFCFSDIDKLLSALSILRKDPFKTALSQLNSNYYITVYSGFLQRGKLICTLCEFGSFKGIGVVLDAYIAEHGKRITDQVVFA